VDILTLGEFVLSECPCYYYYYYYYYYYAVSAQLYEAILKFSTETHQRVDSVLLFILQS